MIYAVCSSVEFRDERKKKNQKEMDSNPTAVAPPYIDPNIMSDILRRFLLESLVRFRVVSKSLRDLIADADCFRPSKQSSRLDGFFVLTTDSWTHRDPISWEFFSTFTTTTTTMTPPTPSISVSDFFLRWNNDTSYGCNSRRVLMGWDGPSAT
ncbi:hypothetical protein ACLOJK_009126 [Asimina triloba]